VSDDVSQVLIRVRRSRGVSQRALAIRANVSQPLLANIERGEREMTPVTAAAIDKALEITIFRKLVALKGDPVKRRALIAEILGGAAGVAGVAGLAELVSPGLVRAAEENAPTDWDAKINEYEARLVVDPGPILGAAMRADLYSLEDQIKASAGKETFRVAARLSQAYGLHRGDRGDVAGAHTWYRTATTLADRSEHTDTRVWVRGRALSRAPYEGISGRETISRLRATLALSNEPTAGLVEAYSAFVHVYALTNRLAEGRRAVDGMQRVADRLPDGTRQNQRTALFRNYLECRIGPRPDADAAYEAAVPLLTGIDLADVHLYYARTLVRDGQVSDGVDLALRTLTELGTGTRILGVGVADLLSVVPASFRDDRRDALAAYAAQGRMPWEAV
jgi:transcriptional regulator with XRE-family HTH domain